MTEFSAPLKRFAGQGEKTGWTYIEISAKLAQRLKPGNKKSFRVKGRLDDYTIAGVALMPMGGGAFIMAVNAAMRKGIKKEAGATVRVRLEEDRKEIKPPAELMACLRDEPTALAYYKSLAPSHRLYFNRWIESAKTDGTKTKRMAHAVNALGQGQPFNIMLRTLKKDRQDLLG